MVSEIISLATLPAFYQIKPDEMVHLTMLVQAETADQKITVELLPNSRCLVLMRFVGDMHFKGSYIFIVHENAQLVVNGRYLLTKSAAVHLTTDQIHQGRGAQSLVCLRGIIRDQGQWDYSGMMKILPLAHQSQAELYNNSLLEDNGKARSVPSLEVETNQVLCKHGSATGKVDEQALIYLAERGLAIEQAKALLADAFVGEFYEFLCPFTQNKISIF